MADIEELENRVSLIEAFLDGERRQRQNLASMANPNSHVIIDRRHNLVHQIGAPTAGRIKKP